MDNIIPFIEYYLNFAKEDELVKQLIDNHSVKLYKKVNNKLKDLNEYDYDALFRYIPTVHDYIEDKIVNDEVKIKLNNKKKRFKKLLENIFMKQNKNIIKVNKPRFITIGNKINRGIIGNDAKVLQFTLVSNKCCFQRNQLFYLSNSLKIMDIKVRTIHFIKINGNNYQNLPNKLIILKEGIYPGLNRHDFIKRKILRLPYNLIIIKILSYFPNSIEKEMLNFSKSIKNIVIIKDHKRSLDVFKEIKEVKKENYKKVDLYSLEGSEGLQGNEYDNILYFKEIDK